MDVVLASGNLGKIQEFRHILEPLGFSLIPQTELTVPSVKEDGLSFVENALIKARHAASYTHLPALADDSGLVVPALNGEPGIYSARYSGEGATDSKNIETLLQKMQNLQGDERQAYFYCALVFMRHANDPTPLLATGLWKGSILQTKQGDQGFGYDPIFYVSQHACACAELSAVVKNQISHRALAIQALLGQLQAVKL